MKLSTRNIISVAVLLATSLGVHARPTFELKGVDKAVHVSQVSFMLLFYYFIIFNLIVLKFQWYIIHNNVYLKREKNLVFVSLIIFNCNR